MCLAIVNIKGSIPKQSLYNAWGRNPDGAGLLYIENNKLKDYKEMQNFNSFYMFYIALRMRNNKPILIHFRLATQGEINLANAHPVYVNENLGFVHNGIIDWIEYDPYKSDTILFNEKILKNLPDNFLSDNQIVKNIEEIIGNSKIAFLDNKGWVKIINEKMGHWYEGNWYSNTCYRNTIGVFNQNPFYQRINYQQ